MNNHRMLKRIFNLILCCLLVTLTLSSSLVSEATVKKTSPVKPQTLTTFTSINDVKGFMAYTTAGGKSIYQQIEPQKQLIRFEYDGKLLHTQAILTANKNLCVLSKDQKTLTMVFEKKPKQADLILKFTKSSKGLLQVAIAAGTEKMPSTDLVTFKTFDGLTSFATKRYELEKPKNPLVTMTLDNGKTVQMELYPNVAPNTVNNFIALIQSKYYDGLSFHRIVKDFVVQGGDPKGNGTGGPGYTIKGEFTKNGFQNDLSHKQGVLSMARAGDPNSAGSQFFIVLKDAKFLDGQYTAFGMVTKGLDVVLDMGQVPVGPMDQPVTPIKVVTMTVETYGVQYAAPEKVQ